MQSSSLQNGITDPQKVNNKKSSRENLHGN